MSKVVHFPESDIEGRNMLQFILKDIEDRIKEGPVDEGEAKVDVGLPALEGWVVNLSESLNLLVLALCCEG
jgi:hypothetical protein